MKKDHKILLGERTSEKFPFTSSHFSQGKYIENHICAFWLIHFVGLETERAEKLSD